MTFKHPVLPSRSELVPSRSISPHGFISPPKAAQIGRRGLLGAFLALVPAATAGSASAALPAPVQREGRRLIWLGRQLDQAEAAFTVALERKARCRDRAEMAYPEPPAEITWQPGERPPAWCGTRDESDVDGKAVYWRADSAFRSTPRQIAAADLLEDYLARADRRTKTAREARRLLTVATTYEAEVEHAIDRSGYRAAYREAYELGRRIDRIAGMIFKCECTTFEGVAIKALALLVAVKADAVDEYIGHRSKVLYAERLAGSVLQLGKTA